jgi:Spy/CpxP family protein refolding chaperone
MVISTRMRALGTILSTAVVLTAGSLIAQESKTGKSDAPAKRPVDSARRVPAFFGQIGLTPEQRENIYKIRGKHQAKIDELEKEIDEIQARMLVECEAVLTASQKQMLAERRKATAADKKEEEPEKTTKARAKSKD